MTAAGGAGATVEEGCPVRRNWTGRYKNLTHRRGAEGAEKGGSGKIRGALQQGLTTEGTETAERTRRKPGVTQRRRAGAESMGKDREGKGCRSKDRRYMGEPFLFQSLRKSAVVGA